MRTVLVRVLEGTRKGSENEDEGGGRRCSGGCPHPPSRLNGEASWSINRRLTNNELRLPKGAAEYRREMVSRPRSLPAAQVRAAQADPLRGQGAGKGLPAPTRNVRAPCCFVEAQCRASGRRPQQPHGSAWPCAEDDARTRWDERANRETRSTWRPSLSPRARLRLNATFPLDPILSVRQASLPGRSPPRNCPPGASQFRGCPWCASVRVDTPATCGQVAVLP
jgi:hypothetical protein